VTDPWKAQLAGLTEAQRQAVEHTSGPLLILAGPGSGKTRVITHRVACLLRQGVPSRAILALTFTNKAAQEMQARVARLVPGQPVWMGTFHRFCAQRLRHYASLLGLQPNYSIYDTSDAKAALKVAIEQSRVSTSHVTPEQIGSAISRFKNRLLLPEDLADRRLESSRETIAARVYPIYRQSLLQANAVDFDDLLLHMACLLRDYPDLRSELDARYQYVMVDEYQDTNLAQYAIARGLSIDSPNLAVVGDPDQSIYSWRGADRRNVLQLEQDYPELTTIRLEENFRSTPAILRAADALIRHNRQRKHKTLWTHRPEAAAVRLVQYASDLEEAEGIADAIASAVQSGQRRYSDFAVCYRISALSRTLEMAMRSRVIPYYIARGVEFYQRKEIKDVLAYLHLLNNPQHDVALRRIINVPVRGIGAKTVDRLQAYAQEHGVYLLAACRQAGLVPGIPPRTAGLVARFVAMYDRLSIKSAAPLEDLLRELLDETKLREYYEAQQDEDADNNPVANLDELVSAAVEFDARHPQDGSLEKFLEEVALVSDTDEWDGESDRVSLMTLHAAKGLEFPCVFIVAVEQDTLPHSRSRESSEELEEERRLLFVGMTRAIDQLQLSVARRRLVRGAPRIVAPSHFLFELPRDEFEVIETQDPARFMPRSGDWDLPDRQWNDEPDFIQHDAMDESDSPVQRAGLGSPWPLGIHAARVRQAAGLEEDQSELHPSKSTRPGRISRRGPSTMKTAADLLREQQQGSGVPPEAYQVGMVVSHPRYGSGRIQTLSGAGLKRTAEIVFFSDNLPHRFVLALTPLTIEEQAE
jgi:DNA helicase-2/ATP-dependent DNA helicase PcrA